MTILRADLVTALVDLFEGWVKPHVQFSAGPLTPIELERMACQFYALNCRAFESAELSPEELLKFWSSRRTDI